ncbi:hypothetical protein CYY_008175 [Polysphondylium violaceum]|uniref:ER membrane protein complex subunit 4 n=1 Tax=Polysphondylium violaceum TaxID=133409 RepID=A0A8J4PNI8_9MYCE|nr:hypothetical protein CYY_008175 [Polysphondylium violaceum]
MSSNFKNNNTGAYTRQWSLGSTGSGSNSYINSGSASTGSGSSNTTQQASMINNPSKKSGLVPPASTSPPMAANQLTAAQSLELKKKKGWELAKSPAKNILMTGFFLWMIGNGINIFTMPVIIYAVINPIKAIFQVNAMFSRFSDLKDQVMEMKMTYIGIQLLLLGVTLYKCSSMGILPITQSDWISSLPIKKTIEFSSGSWV